MFLDVNRSAVDELFMITQPAHLQRQFAEKLGADERDVLRADMLRERLRSVRRPVIQHAGSNTPKLDKSKEA
jgi:protein arginine kinase